MRSNRARAIAVALAATLASAKSASAEPAVGAPGCCCVAQGESYTCSEKTQANCLALQPAAPTYARTEDFRKAWNEAVAASQAQAARPSRGGWIAGACER